MGIDPIKLKKALAVSFAVIFTLNLLDVSTTLLCLTHVAGTFERNVLFAPLLNSEWSLIFSALLVKFSILPPLALAVIIPLKRGKFELIVKTLKLGVLIGMVAAIPLYIWIIFFNNLPIVVKILS
jgi:hypothetical protein